MDTGYSTLHMNAHQSAVESSADHPADPHDPYHTSSFPNFTVSWPHHFIDTDDRH